MSPVVLRFRFCLESLGLAAGTINQRLAAVRGVAYEAADSGLLGAELAAGICCVKGVKQLGSPCRKLVDSRPSSDGIGES